jgi:hypothetical protein
MIENVCEKSAAETLKSLSLKASLVMPWEKLKKNSHQLIDLSQIIPTSRTLF